MTWSARITRPDGTNPIQEGATAPDYQACQSCQHGQYDFETDGKKIQPCYLPKASSGIGNVLTSIDTGADGHMASGEALLKCNGYQPKE